MDIIPTKTDYTIQSHAISRAAYTMPVLLRRLVYLAMAHAKPLDSGLMEITMAVGDIARALDMPDGGNIYDRLRSSIDNAMSYVLHIDLPNKGWKAFQWFSYAEYNPENDTITIQLHEKLRPYVIEMQKAFTTFYIADISKLQSRYSLRWFELVMSRQGQADASDHWWYEIDIITLRELFKIEEKEYPRTGNLRTKVIDYPIEEINNADIGIQLTPEYIRQGKKLHAVRMHCKKIGRTDLKQVHKLSKQEISDEEFINKNREQYDRILHTVKSQLNLPGIQWASPEIMQMTQEAEALKQLKAELAKVQPKRGRGRPRKIITS